MNGSVETLRAFLSEFFGEGNQLDPSDPGFAHRLEPWLARLEADSPTPTVLPRKAEDGRFYLYGIAFDPHGRAALEATLRAFIGPSWSDEPWGESKLHFARDPIDATVFRYTGGWGFRRRLATDGPAPSAIRISLDLMLAMDAGRPTRDRELKLPVAQLLYDFEVALQLGDIRRSDSALEALHRSREVEQVNLWFLRIRQLARFERWAEILESRFVREVACISPRQRPHAVSEDLLQAAIRGQVLPASGGIDGQRRAWRSTVPVEVMDVVGSIARATRPSTHAALLLDAAERGAPGAVELMGRALSQVAPEDPERSLVEALAGILEVGDAPEVCTEDVARLLATGDAQAAWLVAREIKEWTPEVSRLLVEAACAAGLPEAALELQERLPTEALVDAGSATGSSGTSASLEALGGFRAQHMVPGWGSWFERVAQADADLRLLLRVMRSRSDAWSADLRERGEAAMRTLVHLVGVALDSQPRAVRQALPRLLEGLMVDDAWGRSELQELTLELIDAVLLGLAESGMGDQDLAVLAQLFEAALRPQLASSELAERLGFLAGLMRSHLRIGLIAEASDLLETILIWASNDVSTVAVLGDALAHALRQAPTRVPGPIRRALNSLLADLGVPRVELADRVAEASSPLDWLRGKRLGIYSLNESAARRAKSLLEEELARDVDIRLDHSTVGTESLKTLARESDVLVVVTAAATHAATEFIDDNLGAETVRIRMHVRGSSGLIQGLRAPPGLTAVA